MGSVVFRMTKPPQIAPRRLMMVDQDQMQV